MVERTFMDNFTFKDMKTHMKKWILTDFISPEDIPSIELYMDQITTFMDTQLEGNKRTKEDKILTKTMINNYSKNNLLPPSTKKKYSKDHIILLIFIYYFKNFLSISDIQKLLKPMTDTYFGTNHSLTLPDIYKELFDLEHEYSEKIQTSINEVYQIADEQFEHNDDYLKTFAMIVMLSYDIYAKKQLVEHLIDNLHTEPTTKAALKEAKELAKQKEKIAKQQGKKSKPQ